MLDQINGLLYPLGIKIDKLPKFGEESKAKKIAPMSLEAFTLRSYLKEDGTFDYDRYRQIQTEGNKRKIDGCWVLENNIRYLSDYLAHRLGRKIEKGVCQGTRRGMEQAWFRKYLNADVFGTEISDTAAQFPHTIQWDFHEVKPEWVGAFDFVYSNSFDHSYDPDKCLNAWMSMLKPDGICILEHADGHSPTGVTELDPFGAHLVQMPNLVAQWGRGKFAVTEILDAPYRLEYSRTDNFIIIEPS